MLNLILSLLACAAPQAAFDSTPTDTVDPGPDYVPAEVPPTHFTCDDLGTGLAAIPEGAWGVGVVMLAGCDSADGIWPTEEWSLSATRVIVACDGACGGLVTWNPTE